MSVPILPIRDPEAVRRAADLILAGKIIVVPTDTIYGLAVRPDALEAIRRLYEIRERDPEPATPLLMSHRRHLRTLARPNRVARILARRFWPGPLTLLLPAAAHLPSALRARPVALRTPNFPPLWPLLDAVGGYLLVTGASKSGYPPAITAQEAAAYVGDAVALILDGGRSPFGVPSTIVNCIPRPPQIIRRGAIATAKIHATLHIAPCPAEEFTDRRSC